MSNLIRSDLFRLRKGTTLFATFIAALGMVLLLVFVLWVADAGNGGAISGDDPAATLQQAETRRSAGVGVVSTSQAIYTGTGFVREIQGQNIAAFFLLPLIVAVFADDFNCDAFRNTLSYETDRKKIYLSKLLLSFALTLLLLLCVLLGAMLFGGIFFGFAGMFQPAFLLQCLVSLLLTTPLYFALVAFGHWAVALTRKNGPVIAIYLVTLMVYSSVVMLIAMLLPSLEWITLLDIVSGIAYLSYYTVLPTWEIFSYLGLGLGLGALFLALGLARYTRTDMP